MAREEGLMKQVEELKRKIREVEKEKEEIRRRKEAMMRESDAGGSAMHVGLQGQEGMHVKLQLQMVVADVNFFSGAGGSAMHVELQPQMVAADVNFFSGTGGSAMHVGLQGQEDYHDGPLSEVFGSPESTEVDYYGEPLSEVSGSPEWLQTNNVEMTMFSLSEVPSAAPATGGTVFSAASVGGAPASSAVVAASVESAAEPAISGTVPSAASVRGEVGGRESPAGTASSDAVAEAAPLTGDTVISDASVERADEQLTLDESSAGTASSDAVAKAAPLTGDTAAPDASVERVAGKLTLKAGFSSEICGERGASTHPFDPGIMFPLEVRYASSSSSSTSNSNSNSSSSSSSSSSSHKDVAYAGALLRPFDPGKRYHRGARIEKAVRGLDLPFDRGKTWRRMQHEG